MRHYALIIPGKIAENSENSLQGIIEFQGHSYANHKRYNSSDDANLRINIILDFFQDNGVIIMLFKKD